MVEPWMFGVAILLTTPLAGWLGFVGARHRRNKAECRANGHQWIEINGRLRCTRCLRSADWRFR